MKTTINYKDVKIQFLYFFLIYEILHTDKLKLFLLLFFLLLIDVIINTKNMIEIFLTLNKVNGIEEDTKIKKNKIKLFLLSILIPYLCFVIYVLITRQEFWLVLF